MDYGFIGENGLGHAVCKERRGRAGGNDRPISTGLLSQSGQSFGRHRAVHREGEALGQTRTSGGPAANNALTEARPPQEYHSGLQAGQSPLRVERAGAVSLHQALVRQKGGCGQGDAQGQCQQYAENFFHIGHLQIKWKRESGSAPVSHQVGQMRQRADFLLGEAVGVNGGAFGAVRKNQGVQG